MTEAQITEVVRRVAELPDRSSPDDWPEAMLVTGPELAGALRDVSGRTATELTGVVPDLRCMDSAAVVAAEVVRRVSGLPDGPGHWTRLDCRRRRVGPKGADGAGYIVTGPELDRIVRAAVDGVSPSVPRWLGWIAGPEPGWAGVAWRVLVVGVAVSAVSLGLGLALASAAWWVLGG